MKRFLPALLPLLMVAGCSSQTVTPTDKTAFITVSDLPAFGYTNPKLPQGTWNKTGYGDGTYEIEYEAQTPDGEKNYPLYINESLSDENTSKDALTYLAGTRGAMNLALKAQSLTEKSVPNQIIYGDGSSLTTLQSGKIAVGNIFSARKGGRTFSLMIVGITFDDPKNWDDFVGKKVHAWLDGAKSE
ncbi:hypothetical protein IAD21_02516 [Abditibacteriota bacterium]|nr:hypothetical protein IAD21_02516 [Abditibacteriota bacterium]